MVCKLLSHGGEILIPDRLLGHGHETATVATYGNRRLHKGFADPLGGSDRTTHLFFLRFGQNRLFLNLRDF